MEDEDDEITSNSNYDDIINQLCNENDDEEDDDVSNVNSDDFNNEPVEDDELLPSHVDNQEETAEAEVTGAAAATNTATTVNLNDSFEELISEFNESHPHSHLSAYLTNIEGENDVDEENMFAENDIDNSLQQQQQQITVPVAAVEASSSGNLAPGISEYKKAFTALNLDNDEALKEIKNQLSEIKVATTVNNNKTNREEET